MHHIVTWLSRHPVAGLQSRADHYNLLMDSIQGRDLAFCQDSVGNAEGSGFAMRIEKAVVFGDGETIGHACHIIGNDARLASHIPLTGDDPCLIFQGKQACVFAQGVEKRTHETFGLLRLATSLAST